MIKRQVFAVSAVNRYIRSLISSDYALRNIYVKGEVSNCRYNPSGHIYFTLKDSSSAMSCIMFAGNRGGLDFELREGMGVIVYGYVGVYERGGSYQLYAREITREGRGELYEAYDALKKKLLAEGLFDKENKKPLPPYPRILGVATARTGAVIHDILNVSLRRNPWLQIVFCPCKVQGEGSADSVCEAIRALDNYGVDVIIAGRGGGSIEDLMAFNDEKTARAVYECRTPLISAVGHETDTTIMDFVADLRAPTPSAAAELAVPDMRQVIRTIRNYYDNLNARMETHLNHSRERVENYRMAVKRLDPGHKLSDEKIRLMKITDRAGELMQRRLEETKSRLAGQSEQLEELLGRHLESSRNILALKVQRLEGLSPLRQLERGYAFLSDDEGSGIFSVNQADVGQMINAALSDGDIRAEIVSISHKARTGTDTVNTLEVGHG